MTVTDPISPTTVAGASPPPPPAAELYPTVDQVMRVCPQTNRANVEKYLGLILKAMCEGGLTHRNHLIGIIATIYVETPPFAPIREYGRGAGKAYGRTGHYGRGWLQLTWEDNYRKAGQDLGIPDLAGNPDQALEPENAARIFVWFWLGKSGNNPSKAAAAGDWRGTRRAVNGGYNGWDEPGKPSFWPAVQRGLEVFTQDLDPAVIGVYPTDGSYGLGCMDGGNGASRTIAGGRNATTQADALLLALAAHKHRFNGFELRTLINAAAQPEVLKLKAQQKVGLKGLADDLDGDYTTHEVIVYPLAAGGIEVDILASKPDPDDPDPQIFLHDSTTGLSMPESNPLPSGVPSGEIPSRIHQAAITAEGRDTSMGPDGGNLACAWAVNLFCILPAGLDNIGTWADPNFNNVTVAVKDMVKALDAGRGRVVSRSESVPGDIVIWRGAGHVGVVMEPEGTVIRSNSSSKARFSWDKRNPPPGFEDAIYRVIS